MQPFPSNRAKDGIEDPAVSTLGCLFDGLGDRRQAGDDAQDASQLHIVEAVALVVHTTKHAAHLVLAAGKLLTDFDALSTLTALFQIHLSQLCQMHVCKVRS